MDFLKKAAKLSRDELKTIASYCAVVAALLVAAVFLSTTAPTQVGKAVSIVSPGSSAATPFGVTQGVPEYDSPTPYVGGYPSPLNCPYGSTNCYPYTIVGALSIYPVGSAYGLTRSVDLNNAPTTVGATPTLFAPAPINIEWSCLPSQYASRTCPYTYECGTDWYWCGWRECSRTKYCTAYPDCSINSTYANTSIGTNFNTGGALIGTTTVNFPVGQTSYTYTLQCKNTNTNQVWTAATKVQVTTATLSLTANPTQVVPGGTSNLTWATSGVLSNSCAIVDSKGNVGAKGLGTDTSGNGNVWILNNMSGFDQLSDSPTNNFAKLSSANYYSPTYGSGAVYSGGTAAYGGFGAVGDFQLTSGKWYMEYSIPPVNFPYPMVGIWKDPTSGFGYRAYPGQNNDSGIGYGSNGTIFSEAQNFPTTLSSFGQDDIVGVAYDADSGKVYFSRNGIWQNANNLIPMMQAATTNGVTMTDSQEYSSYYGWKAGDKDYTTGWDQYPGVPTVAAPHWLRVDFGASNAKTVRQYSIKNWSPSSSYDPLDFTLEGSNDAATTCSLGNGAAGSTWTVVDTQTNVQWAPASLGYQTKYFTVNSPGSYRCYRVKVTRSSSNQMLFSELGLYAEIAAPTDGTSYAGIIKNGWPGVTSYYAKTYANFGQGGSPGLIFTDSSSFNRKVNRSIGSNGYGVFTYPQVAYTKAKFGAGAQFSSGALKVLPKTADITPSGDYTIDLWVYPTALPGGVGIFSRDSGNGYSPYMIYQNGSRISFYASNTGSDWGIASDEPICPTVAVNNWYHLAVVHSGTNYSLYCNGVRNDTFNRPR